MAKLSAFRTNARAIREGEWIPLPEYGDVEIFVRGFTDAYTDAIRLRYKRAAVPYGGSEDRIPSATRRSINIEALIEYVVRDVRNLTDDEGEPITFEAFCALLREADYDRLVVAVIGAAGMVGQSRAIERQDAADPLAKPSGSA